MSAKAVLLFLIGSLALGLVSSLGPISSEAQEGSMHDCPFAGRWAISVWAGEGSRDIVEALAACGDDAVEAAYYIDPDTQAWSRWFRGRPDISNLETVDAMQGILALGGAAAAPAGGEGTVGPAEEANQIRNCPVAGKWAITVWSGQDGTDADQALTTCGEGVVVAAYYLDPETQSWLRWFADRPDLSNLQALRSVHGIIAFGTAGAPGPTPEPPEEDEFFEEYPAWNMPDLAVTSLAAEPDRANPSDSIGLRASVINVGTGDAGPSELIFLVDDEEIGRTPVDPLAVASEIEVDAAWTAHGPGRHQVIARLEPGPESVDVNSHNNLRTATVRVSGEADPEPELELDMELDERDLIPGESRTVTLSVRNPSFAEVGNIPMEFYIDDDLIFEAAIEHLAPGERQQLEFPWLEVTPGEHTVMVWMHLPDEFPHRDLQGVQSWHFAVPDTTVLYDQMAQAKWMSIGPRILTNGRGGLPTYSVGRMDVIAFHPTDSKTMYAGSPAGGLWKTTNGGDGWSPLTDKLPPLGVGSVAVDPKNGDIVYLGTGSSIYRGGVGIYKSVDAGKSWSLFADKAIDRAGGIHQIKGVSKVVVRYPSPGNVLIYAATNVGVLRYKSSDPLAEKSTPSEWLRIKSGGIADMVVHPTSNLIAYASVRGEGVCRTLDAENGAELDWDCIDPVHITSAKGQWYTLDVYWGNPSRVYAAIKDPRPDTALEIAWKDESASLWSGIQFSKPAQDARHDFYNPFVRVSPQNKDLFYFGGVKLYKMSAGSQKVKIEGIHDDMHGMEWDPNDASTYYTLGDGGIWRCKVEVGQANDSCTHRNYNLRTTMFFDFDASKTDSNLMIGGTQDNGTILYQGTPDWKIVKGGDGLFSLIAESQNIRFLYAQHQTLDSTARSEAGANTTHFPQGGDWKTANNGLPQGHDWGWQKAQIAVDPNGRYHLVSVGDQVYFTDNGGDKWRKVGPTASNVKGHITRVSWWLPGTDTIIAGTSKGQIWVARPSYPYGFSWTLVDEHPDGAAVKNMGFSPLDRDVLYVVYSGGNGWQRMRQLRLFHDPLSALAYPIVGDFPVASRTPLVIVGDGHKANVAYVGTDRGVFRGEAPYEGGIWTWKPYNNGFPLVEVTDLLVDPTSKELRAATWGRGAWTVTTGP